MPVEKDPSIPVPLSTTLDLALAIGISLTTRARARAEDGVQDPTVLGGWPGDSYPDVEGDNFGSRLWTLEGRSMANALELAPDIVDEALQWLIDDGVIVSFSATFEVMGPGVLGISITPRLLSGKLADVYGPWQISV